MARGSKTSRIPRASTRTARKKTTGKKTTGTTTSGVSPRLIPRVLGRAALGIGLLVVLASFLNSFLLAPGRTWFGQRDEISAREAELATIQAANDELQKDIDRLQTPAGVEDAAREELGFVMAGEERQTIIGDAEAPLALPTGWPYDLVTQIVGVREAEAAAQAAAEAAKNSGNADDEPVSSEPIPVDATPTTVTAP